jgi:hypothetical protein
MASHAELLFDPAYTVVVEETCTEKPCSAVLHLVHTRSNQTVETYVAAGHLGEGGLGVVRLYEGETSRHQIAVKQLRADDGEIAVVSRIEQNRIDCGIIGIRTTRCSDCRNAYTVMERMDGSLGDLLATGRGLPRDSVLHLVDTLTEQLTCLAAAGLLYTDLKFANVLYRRSRTGEHTYRLGDLGSISIAGPHVTTYPLLTSEKYEQLQAAGGARHSLYSHYHFLPTQSTAKSCILYQLARMVAFLADGLQEHAGGEGQLNKRQIGVNLSRWKQKNYALSALGIEDHDLQVVCAGAPRYSLQDNLHRVLQDDIVYDRTGVIYTYRIEELGQLREWQHRVAGYLSTKFPDRPFHTWLVGGLSTEAVDELLPTPAPGGTALRKWAAWVTGWDK